jgi:anti-anti-sigma factor
MLQLKLDPRVGEHTAIVHCAGRIVYHQEARMLADTVRSLIESHDRVILDLSEVHDVDSAGLGTFASLYLYAREQQRSFALMNPRASVRDVLELTQLDRHLQVMPGNKAARECAA